MESTRTRSSGVPAIVGCKIKNEHECEETMHWNKVNVTNCVMTKEGCKRHEKARTRKSALSKTAPSVTVESPRPALALAPVPPPVRPLTRAHSLPLQLKPKLSPGVQPPPRASSFKLDAVPLVSLRVPARAKSNGVVRVYSDTLATPKWIIKVRTTDRTVADAVLELKQKIRESSTLETFILRPFTSNTAHSDQTQARMLPMRAGGRFNDELQIGYQYPVAILLTSWSDPVTDDAVERYGELPSLTTEKLKESMMRWVAKRGPMEHFYKALKTEVNQEIEQLRSQTVALPEKEHGPVLPTSLSRKLKHKEALKESLALTASVLHESQRQLRHMDPESQTVEWLFNTTGLIMRMSSSIATKAQDADLSGTYDTQVSSLWSAFAFEFGSDDKSATFIRNGLNVKPFVEDGIGFLYDPDKLRIMGAFKTDAWIEHGNRKYSQQVANGLWKRTFKNMNYTKPFTVTDYARPYNKFSKVPDHPWSVTFPPFTTAATQFMVSKSPFLLNAKATDYPELIIAPKSVTDPSSGQLSRSSFSNAIVGIVFTQPARDFFFNKKNDGMLNLIQGMLFKIMTNVPPFFVYNVVPSASLSAVPTPIYVPRFTFGVTEPKITEIGNTVFIGVNKDMTEFELTKKIPKSFTKALIIYSMDNKALRFTPSFVSEVHLDAITDFVVSRKTREPVHSHEYSSVLRLTAGDVRVRTLFLSEGRSVPSAEIVLDTIYPDQENPQKAAAAIPVPDESNKICADQVVNIYEAIPLLLDSTALTPAKDLLLFSEQSRLSTFHGLAWGKLPGVNRYQIQCARTASDTEIGSIFFERVQDTWFIQLIQHSTDAKAAFDTFADLNLDVNLKNFREIMFPQRDKKYARRQLNFKTIVLSITCFDYKEYYNSRQVKDFGLNGPFEEKRSKGGAIEVLRYSFISLEEHPVFNVIVHHFNDAVGFGFLQTKIGLFGLPFDPLTVSKDDPRCNRALILVDMYQLPCATAFVEPRALAPPTADVIGTLHIKIIQRPDNLIVSRHPEELKKLFMQALRSYFPDVKTTDQIKIITSSTQVEDLIFYLNEEMGWLSLYDRDDNLEITGLEFSDTAFGGRKSRGSFRRRKHNFNLLGSKC